MAATALPPVASIGSIISTKLSAMFRGQLVQMLTPIAVASSRCRPMWPTRAAGSSSSTASSMPSPARSTGTTTTSPATTSPSAGPSGVVTVDGFEGTSFSASAASSTEMRFAARRNSGAGVLTSRSSISASWTSG